MEDNFFLKPTVAGLLNKEYIEARLHTDGTANAERIKEMQTSLARTVAMPVFVIVDPATEKELGRYEGAALTPGQQRSYIEFLEKPTARE